MMDPLRVLLLEDSETDAELIKHELHRSGIAAVANRVDSEQAFVKAVREFSPQIVLSDHAVAQFDTPAALIVLRTLSPTTPLIVVTGSLEGGRPVACIRQGAEDVILKTNLHRLAAAITDALAVRRPLERLTKRQIEVLKLVAEGHRTSGIANQLGLSVKTVESHRGQVMKRLRMHNVVSLTRYAMRVGLIAA
jgi:DNA-binding NarL/FixJ family response regulator